MNLRSKNQLRLALIVFTFGSLAEAQQAPLTPKPIPSGVANPVEASRLAVKQLVTAELEIARSLASMTETQAASVTAQLEPTVDAAAKQQLAYRTLPSEVAESLVTAMQKHCGAATAKKYAADREVRRDFAKKSYVKAAVVVLDEIVGLTDTQREAMEPIFAEMWSLRNDRDPDSVRPFEFYLYGNLPAPRGNFANAVSKILTKDQCKQWNSPMYAHTANDRRQEVVAAAVDLQITRLTSALELGTRQQASLKVLKKGTVPTAVKAYGAAETWLWGDHAAEPTLETVRKIEPLFHTPGGLVIAHTRWNSRVRSILTAPQRQRYDRLLRDRAERLHVAFAYMFCDLIDRQRLLSGEQLLELQKTLSKSTTVEPKGKRFSVKAFRQILALPESEPAKTPEDDDPLVAFLFHMIRNKNAAATDGHWPLLHYP